MEWKREMGASSQSCQFHHLSTSANWDERGTSDSDQPWHECGRWVNGFAVVCVRVCVCVWVVAVVWVYSESECQGVKTQVPIQETEPRQAIYHTVYLCSFFFFHPWKVHLNVWL